MRITAALASLPRRSFSYTNTVMQMRRENKDHCGVWTRALFSSFAAQSITVTEIIAVKICSSCAAAPSNMQTCDYCVTNLRVLSLVCVAATELQRGKTSHSHENFSLSFSCRTKRRRVVFNKWTDSFSTFLKVHKNYLGQVIHKSL